MRISLDYDQTYTADPQLWEAFISLAKQRGHEVICVTKREPELKTQISVPTIYTSRGSKIKAVAQAGIRIDVWIDDNVLGIIADDHQTVTLS